MSKMNEVAKLLGVALEEHFSVDGYGDKKFYLSKYGLFEFKDSKGYECPNVLQCLLSGRYKLRKLPWRAKYGADYYIPCIGIGVQSTICKCNDYPQFDKAMYDQGFMCKTSADAENLSKMFIDVAKKYRKMTNNEEGGLD